MDDGEGFVCGTAKMTIDSLFLLKIQYISDRRSMEHVVVEEEEDEEEDCFVFSVRNVQEYPATPRYQTNGLFLLALYGGELEVTGGDSSYST